MEMARMWREASNDALLATTADGVSVSIAASLSPEQALCKVYVSPPEVLNASTIRVSSTLKTVVAFTQGSNKFLAFKLNLTN